MNIFSIVFAVITFFSTLIGGLFAVKYRKSFGILAAFAAGILIAVPLFDLLPEAHEKNHPLVAIGFTLIGFLLIYIITGLLGV